MNIKKGIGYAGVFLAAGLGSAALFPQLAFAGVSNKGWNAKDMIDNAYGNTTGMKTGTFNGSTVAQWVGTITTWILGIAIACFVLKVVLTAIAKMLHSDASVGAGATPYSAKPGGGSDKGSSPLCNIPIVGAYDPSMEWKTIFVHFGKQVGVVAGAWLIVQIIVNIVLFVLGQVTVGSGVNSGTA